MKNTVLNDCNSILATFLYLVIMCISFSSRGDAHRPGRCSNSSRHHYPGAWNRGRTLSYYKRRFVCIYMCVRANDSIFVD